MNFAEAALVIQGSACVYSKKVSQHCATRDHTLYTLYCATGRVSVQAGLPDPQHDQQQKVMIHRTLYIHSNLPNAMLIFCKFYTR